MRMALQVLYLRVIGLCYAHQVARALGAAAFVCTSAKNCQGVLKQEGSDRGGDPDTYLDPAGVMLKDKILEICECSFCHREFRGPHARSCVC